MPKQLEPLHVLFVEDSEDDALLIGHELRRGGYQVLSERVQTAQDLETALKKKWDVVLSDFNMPRFSGDQALKMVRASDDPDVPFIVVSGTIGEESAVAILKAGANDFVVKTKIALLVPAIERELKDAELRRERGEAIEGMRKAIQVRDEFLSIASHELKTPVTSLMLQLESALRLTREKGSREPISAIAPKLEAIQKNTRRLTSLIDRLLDISRVTSGRLKLERTETDFHKLLSESIERLGEVCANAGSRLRLKAPPSLTGHWDPDRLEAVVSNLLTNAIKYGGGNMIDVVLEDLGQSARLTVRDHGIGIAAEDQARIFGRFERAVSSRHFGGFGVGLWLSRQIVEAHGGSIRVQSEPEKGSTFEVELPKS